MKKAASVMLLVLGVSVYGGVFACEAGGHHQTESATSVPPTPAPAPAK